MDHAGGDTHGTHLAIVQPMSDFALWRVSACTEMVTVVVVQMVSEALLKRIASCPSTHGYQYKRVGNGPP